MPFGFAQAEGVIFLFWFVEVNPHDAEPSIPMLSATLCHPSQLSTAHPPGAVCVRYRTNGSSQYSLPRGLSQWELTRCKKAGDPPVLRHIDRLSSMAFQCPQSPPNSADRRPASLSSIRSSEVTLFERHSWFGGAVETAPAASAELPVGAGSRRLRFLQDAQQSRWSRRRASISQISWLVSRK